ncbi:hypothetical protein ColTof4_02999 [Colletotrichum tofieldiae]|nr:hypothetical protein ColTof3_13595 [Colletotrichum tofieldiae]GKT70575.1 hypothetical protein ColTof4_02999 [Colletotrichum tofieldiae]GKT94555.1 hypothetical protein Ct61P_12405 [Colletotrichum tofieldiae]
MRAAQDVFLATALDSKKYELDAETRRGRHDSGAGCILVGKRSQLGGVARQRHKQIDNSEI